MYVRMYVCMYVCMYVTEARIAAEPLSCSCCEAQSEGFERGSVREIGLCVLC